MAKCVNEHCNKDPLTTGTSVPWGSDGDLACSRECYHEAKKQMDYFCRVTLRDDKLFADWLGVDVDELK